MSPLQSSPKILVSIYFLRFIQLASAFPLVHTFRRNDILWSQISICNTEWERDCQSEEVDEL